MWIEWNHRDLWTLRYIFIVLIMHFREVVYIIITLVFGNYTNYSKTHIMRVFYTPVYYVISGRRRDAQCVCRLFNQINVTQSLPGICVILDRNTTHIRRHYQISSGDFRLSDFSVTLRLYERGNTTAIVTCFVLFSWKWFSISQIIITKYITYFENSEQ